MLHFLQHRAPPLEFQRMLSKFLGLDKGGNQFNKCLSTCGFMFCLLLLIQAHQLLARFLYCRLEASVSACQTWKGWRWRGLGLILGCEPRECYKFKAHRAKPSSCHLVFGWLMIGCQKYKCLWVSPLLFAIMYEGCLWGIESRREPFFSNWVLTLTNLDTMNANVIFSDRQWLKYICVREDVIGQQAIYLLGGKVFYIEFVSFSVLMKVLRFFSCQSVLPSRHPFYCGSWWFVLVMLSGWSHTILFSILFLPAKVLGAFAFPVSARIL